MTRKNYSVKRTSETWENGGLSKSNKGRGWWRKTKGKRTIKQIFFNYVLMASNRLYADFGNNLKKIRMHC